MKAVLINFFVLLGVSSVGQTSKDFYLKKGEFFLFKYYLSDSTSPIVPNPTDSALSYFYKSRNSFPDFEQKKLSDYISYALFEKKEYLNSLEISKKLLPTFDLTNDDERNSANGICYRLFRTYLMLQDYKHAILYYDSSSSKYRSSFTPLDCFSNPLPQAYELFSCYYHLSEYEKATSFLTRFMFSTNEYLYSIPDSVWNEYEIALKKAYSIGEIQKQLNDAIYKLEYNSETSKKIDDSVYHISVKYKYSIFDCKFEGSSSESNSTGITDTRENFIKEIQKSKGYRMLYSQ